MFFVVTWEMLKLMQLGPVLIDQNVTMTVMMLGYIFQI